MKKSLSIIVLGLLGFVGFTRANVNSMAVAPATQSAISGSLVTFTVTGSNGTGDAYLRYVLPKTAAYDILYQNANLTPVNLALLTLGTEHDPVFYIPANSNFSVTITAKTNTTVRTIPTITTTPEMAADMLFSSILTSAVAQITPIADLSVANVLTGMNPSFSGDTVSYYILLQNIGSTAATGITFISTFPIPTLNSPIATFAGTPRAYNYINYPQDFVRTGAYLNNLNPGQTMIITLDAPMMQAFPIGTTFNQIAKATTASPELSTGNNSATAAGAVQAAADVRVTKTLAPFTGYNIGDQVRYTLTYGNSGGKPASNVTITDIVPAGITIPLTTFALGTLPAGSGGTIVLTGTLTSLLASGYTFVNTANISTTSAEGAATGNNSSTVTGTVQGIANVSVSIIANNLSNASMDNAPYGSGPSVLIQAVSGDLVQFTITYTNFGNVTGTNAVIGLSGTQGLVSIGTYNGTIGNLGLNTTGTLIITGIVGPRNYISFTPTARLTYNSGTLLTDSVIVQEPLVCGDGILTRNEPCDTLGNLGVLFSGQVCQNQQGMCVLVTQSIINNACVNYQYTNSLGVITTGQTCASATATLMNAACTSMTGSTPTATSNGYDVNYTCRGNNTTATTPITINCGNGTSVAGMGSQLNGTCSYTSGYNGTAQCSVGSDMNNAACRLPVAPNQLACNLNALDGNVVIVDGDNDNFDGTAQFRCSTVGGVTAASISIDCGNGDPITSDTNVSSYTKTCRYNEGNTDNHMEDLPRQSTVRCTINNSSNQTCQQSVIVDQGIFGRCGDGIVQGYEDCDDGDANGTPASNCSEGCDIKDAGLVGCFNISNANLSVQENELLPFRWKVDGDKNTVTTCTSSNENKVQNGSLQCTFNIYNKDGVVDTITEPCKNSNSSAIFNYFNTVGAYGKYTTLVNHNMTDGIYGEYKINLDEVNYKYCDGNSFVSGAPLKRVCGTNFTVTRPYIIQKSSFGLTPATTTNPDLEDFYSFIKPDQTIVTATELNKIMVINADTYKGGSTITTMMGDFITKYSKLAVKYTTVKSEEGNTLTAYKVPGKDIVVFKGNGTLVYTDGATKTKPFTVIVDGPSLKINGSITNTNAMFLVNKGDITFLPSADSCKKTQVVKGIFVTNQGSFLAGPKDFTNDSPSKERCAYGGLDVQGILIGKGIDNIVQSRRSQLNHRFTTLGTSDAAIKTERRNEIFNGAALLIEYSPSLWNALPPGASEFTKALDVYKQ